MNRLLQHAFTPNQATSIGLLAVAFWSSVVGLIRALSLHMGAVGGAAVMYSLSTLLLLAIFGLPNLRQFSRSYLFWASIFFRRLRIVPVSFHRFCRQRTPSGRSRHGQLSLADVYHHRRGLV